MAFGEILLAPERHKSLGISLAPRALRPARYWLAACAIAAMTFFVSCDGASSRHGTITDSDGQPVAGAKVRLYDAKEPRIAQTVMSDSSGQYSLDLVHAPGRVTIVLEVTKTGFVPFRQRLSTFGGADKGADVQLREDAS